MDKKLRFVNAIKYIIILLVITAVQLGLLISVALIPRHAIQTNVNKSADYLLERSVFFYLNSDDISSRIDRYADSIILNIAYNYDSEHPLASVMSSSYYFTETANENENLKVSVTEQPDPTTDYARYWHGSNVIIRPLLTFLDIQHMYILNAILLILLLVITFLLINKYFNIGTALCFAVGVVMISPWYVPFSLEYTWAILFMLVASILILKIKEKSSFALTAFFLIVGSFTAYFDFLTTETLTLTIPLTLLLCYKHSVAEIPDLKSGIKFSFSMACFWLIGYASAWITKWTLASVVLQKNVFISSIDQAQYRINGAIDSANGLSRCIAAIIRNIACLFPFSYQKNSGAALFIIIMIIIISVYYVTKKKTGCYMSTLFFLLSLLPFVRFFFLSNHSYIHYFFTYRALLSTIFCIGLAMMYGVDWEHIAKKLKSHKQTKAHRKKKPLIKENYSMKKTHPPASGKPKNENSLELTILMPCLNEEANIADSITAAKNFLEKHHINGEILISDNGSTDNSVNIARQMGARIVTEKKQGYGYALRCGINASKGSYTIIGDCDTTYDFENIMPFLTELRQGTDFVIGNRFAGGIEKGAMPFLHKYIGIPFLSFLGRIRYKVHIKDFHCGLRGFNTAYAQSLPFTSTGMEFATEIIARFAKTNGTIKEVPTTLSKSHLPRKPHLRTIHDGMRHLIFMLKKLP